LYLKSATKNFIMMFAIAVGIIVFALLVYSGEGINKKQKDDNKDSEY